MSETPHSRRSLLRMAGAGIASVPLIHLGNTSAEAESVNDRQLRLFKAQRNVGSIDDPATNSAKVVQSTTTTANTAAISVSAAAYLRSCAADIGRIGDDYVWNSLADYTGNATLRQWALQDAPYCAGGMQLNRWRLGLGGYPNPLPYYVPSIRDHAKAKGQWLSRASAQPGDWVVMFNAGHVGVLEQKNADGTVTTIEYNTSSGNSGSQTNGRGCWRRVRSATSVDGFVRHHTFSGTVPTEPPALLKGSTGTRVTLLQKTMNLWFPSYASTPLVVDGSFGPATEAAVKEFQGRIGLAVDGVFGPNTRSKFAASTGVWV